MTKCSIITVCYNNRDGLRQTAESVAAQTFRDYEFIVIDGGSTDGSEKLLGEYASIITYGVSEKDGGIYNAMNKGIAHASGEYCLFLNSGDYFSDQEVLERVFSHRYTEDIIYGNVIRTLKKKKKIVRYPDNLHFVDFYKRIAVIHHQAAFIKREMFDRYGLYREDLFLNADWQFFFKAIVLNNASSRHINTVISICNATGASNAYDKDDPRLKKDYDEKIKSLLNANPGFILQEEKTDIKQLYDRLLWNISVLFKLSLYVKLGK